MHNEQFTKLGGAQPVHTCNEDYTSWRIFTYNAFFFLASRVENKVFVRGKQKQKKKKKKKLRALESKVCINVLCFSKEKKNPI